MRNFIKLEQNPEDPKDFWKRNHNAALKNPSNFEFAILYMLEGLEAYRQVHKERYGSLIENDYVLIEGVKDIAKGVRVLLNGELGRLDAGTIDGYLVDILKACGVAV